MISSFYFFLFENFFFIITKIFILRKEITFIEKKDEISVVLKSSKQFIMPSIDRRLYNEK
jgi:hypothetical protein